MKQQKAPVSYVSYEVEGRGEFPMDMLRYDGAHPSSSEDVDRMADSRSRRKVRLTAVAKYDTPCVARWESFMWRVVPETMREFKW